MRRTGEVQAGPSLGDFGLLDLEVLLGMIDAGQKRTFCARETSPRTETGNVVR